MCEQITFYDRLMEVRKKAGITIKKMDEDCSCQSKKWKGNFMPSVTALVKLADYFDVSVDYLLGRDTDVQESDLISKFRKMSSAHKNDLMRIAEGFEDADSPIRKETQIS